METAIVFGVWGLGLEGQGDFVIRQDNKAYDS